MSRESRSRDHASRSDEKSRVRRVDDDHQDRHRRSGNEREGYKSRDGRDDMDTRGYRNERSSSYRSRGDKDTRDRYHDHGRSDKYRGSQRRDDRGSRRREDDFGRSSRPRRDRSSSPRPRGENDRRREDNFDSGRKKPTFSRGPNGSRPTHLSAQQKETEDQKIMKWVAEEDQFVLKQMKHGAIIRVKEGRSKPIDWLAANLRLIEGDPNVYDADYDSSGMDFEIPVPYSVVEGLNVANIEALEQEIQKYAEIDKHPRNAEFWSMMLVLCKNRKDALDKKSKKDDDNSSYDIVQPVSEDIDAVLSGKTYDEFVNLEKEVKVMIDSDDDSIDKDFWERLLTELTIRKAKTKLEQIHEMVISERLRRLRKTQGAEALRSRMQISQLLKSGKRKAAEQVDYNPLMDKIPKTIPIDRIEMNEGVQIQRFDVNDFLKNLKNSRKNVTKLGFVPMRTSRPKDQPRYVVGEFDPAKRSAQASSSLSYSNIMPNPPAEDIGQSAEGNNTSGAGSESVMLDGVENEEELNGDDEIVPLVESSSNDTNLLKPRFYNRVILGYEWNRYNQIHYNSDNPPPKVVQGYKFNIFYPDLIDSKKAPTFSIIRDKHKSSKQLATAAGQNDTCIINFHAGAPYQDIAFKIVDRQWDNSQHRGSRCKFEDGVLQVYFRFKRAFYRK